MQKGEHTTNKYLLIQALKHDHKITQLLTV